MSRLLTIIAAAAVTAAAAPPASTPPTVHPIDRPGYSRMLLGVKGHPVVVNVWATWCDPCREEFPDLVRFHQEMAPRGVRLIGISLDTAASLKDGVIPFLITQGARFDQYIKTPGEDEEFINAVDSGWSGALPATFVYDREGRLIKSIYGSTGFDQLKTIVTPLLAPSK